MHGIYGLGGGEGRGIQTIGVTISRSSFFFGKCELKLKPTTLLVYVFQVQVQVIGATNC